MTNKDKVVELEKIASQVRRDALRMVHAVQSGHPGGSLGCADFMVALYFEVMNIDPKNFTREGTGEDMFFLSNGHISPCLYSVLARRGYFDVAELATFRKLHTRLQGHPSNAHGLPGVRMASGSLGQGPSIALGVAEVKKMNNDPSLVYVLTGDGELEEGQVWEALMYAGSKGVDNIILTVDYNHKQIDGNVEDVMSMLDLKAKFESFGWEVIVGEGNDMTQLLDNLEKARKATAQKKPVAFLMHTEMGYGVDFMCGNNKWHGSAPNDEQLASALSQIPETLGDY
ncbi:MAG: transketolase [Bacteroidales bacterium]|jgi:transketolase|nr:transketolase [Bacteroidales bacterium]MBQ4478588.1 transketolase [Bacteroidales bacterium]